MKHIGKLHRHGSAAKLVKAEVPPDHHSKFFALFGFFLVCLFFFFFFFVVLTNGYTQGALIGFTFEKGKVSIFFFFFVPIFGSNNLGADLTLLIH
jgi:hypothetical protein